MSRSSARPIKGVEAVDSTEERWLQIGGKPPSWISWPKEVIGRLQKNREQNLAVLTPNQRSKRMPSPERAAKALPATTLSIMAVETIRRTKTDPDGKVAGVETFSTMSPRPVYEVIVPKGSEARFSLGMSKVCKLAYYVPNVIIRGVRLAPKLGELTVYPTSDGKLRVRLTPYVSDGKKYISPCGKKVLAGD